MRTVKVVSGAAGCREAVEARGVGVMVDALRASATITSLVAEGARRVWVATEVEQARAMKEQLGDAILIGERDGFPPPGFDGNNSPRGIRELEVDGRDVVFTSTTGAARLGQLEGASLALVGTTINATRVTELIADREDDSPVFTIAAGSRGRPGGTEEDWIGAALIAERLTAHGFAWIDEEVGRDANWPTTLDATSVREGFFAGGNGRNLVAKGLSDDVADCSQIDWIDAVAAVVGYHESDDGPPVAELERIA